MGFLNDLGSTITSLGKEAGEKARELTDTAKLKMEIKSKEDFIERQYIEIGKKVYETEKDADSSAFEEVFAIKQTCEEIESIKKEIADARGVKTCTSCGADMELDANFCPKCGAAN